MFHVEQNGAIRFIYVEFINYVYRFKMSKSTLMSAGDTPGIREA